MIQHNKKFSPSVARNKEPILDVLRPKLARLREDLVHGKEPLNLVEIASGTGEHACHLASNIENLQIQPVEPDLSEHDSIRAWSADLDSNGKSSIREPLPYDIRKLAMWDNDFQPVAMLCINMIHISEWSCTESLFDQAQILLPAGGCLFTYGPYDEEGKEMADSNKAFDESLKSRCKDWGIRKINDIEALAEERGLLLHDRTEMPANNLLLTFQKK